MRREKQEEMQEKDWMLLLFIAKDMTDREGTDTMVMNLWDKLVNYCHANRLIFQDEVRGTEMR